MESLWGIDDGVGPASLPGISPSIRRGRAPEALILFLAFASLAAAPATELKMFATGLGLGILLAATLIRALLVPALVALFGRWNWWTPRWLAR